MPDPRGPGGRQAISRYRIILLLAAAAVIAGALWWRTAAPVAPQIVDVSVPELTGAALAGKDLFDAKCATCHGANAAGSDSGPPLVHIYYEPGHHGDAAFYAAVTLGTRQHHWRFGDMPPVKGVGEAAVAKVIAYVRALQRHNGIH